MRSEQLGRRDAQRFGKPIDNVYASRIHAPFKRANVGAVNVGSVSEFLL